MNVGELRRELDKYPYDAKVFVMHETGKRKEVEAIGLTSWYNWVTDERHGGCPILILKPVDNLQL